MLRPYENNINLFRAFPRISLERKKVCEIAISSSVGKFRALCKRVLNYFRLDANSIFAPINLSALRAERVSIFSYDSTLFRDRFFVSDGALS